MPGTDASNVTASVSPRSRSHRKAAALDERLNGASENRADSREPLESRKACGAQDVRDRLGQLTQCLGAAAVRRHAIRTGVLLDEQLGHLVEMKLR
jgi:hypothetical protein